jgi:hypothetical protein
MEESGRRMARHGGDREEDHLRRPSFTHVKPCCSIAWVRSKGQLGGFQMIQRSSAWNLERGYIALPKSAGNLG